jgi:hypothetical protein
MNKPFDVWTVTGCVWRGGYAKTEHLKIALGASSTIEATRNLEAKS